MALLQVNFVSDGLKRAVPMTVILPVDKLRPGTAPEAPPKFKTLYLLHGLLGNCTDWVCNTRIQQWAQERDLAVVMPSGDNSFYIEQLVANNDYGRFIGRELVELTRRMFPLSTRREDTFLAGLSMGGFGAIRNGLKFSRTFGCIAGLSSAVHIFEMAPDTPGRTLFGEDQVFGDLEAARLTDKNPRVALEQLISRGDPIPEIYMSCGLQDTLLESNRALRDFFLEKGVSVTYREAEGQHNWAFWDSQILEVLNWLPLEKTSAGLNSGNVSGDTQDS